MLEHVAHFGRITLEVPPTQNKNGVQCTHIGRLAHNTRARVRMCACAHLVFVLAWVSLVSFCFTDEFSISDTLPQKRSTQDSIHHDVRMSFNPSRVTPNNACEHVLYCDRATLSACSVPRKGFRPALQKTIMQKRKDIFRLDCVASA